MRQGVWQAHGAASLGQRATGHLRANTFEGAPMNQTANVNHISRRSFIKASAVSLAGMGLASRAYAAGSDTVRVGLIGCGGQGTRDLISCVNSSPGVEIVAMGDLFSDHLQQSLAKLKEEVPTAV